MRRHQRPGTGGRRRARGRSRRSAIAARNLVHHAALRADLVSVFKLATAPDVPGAARTTAA
ncbi:hypothetical protein [Methylibium sp. T29]|uniref:hypothetical protein n=1 Tax=Methylibium sp. T29 TaxID=1430884 RepID=UPI0004B481E6|nr:hypothetical protein [Methylibium sp. T29]